jgi:hypothetical protein
VPRKRAVVGAGGQDFGGSRFVQLLIQDVGQ